MATPIGKGGIGLPPPKGTPIGKAADALLANVAGAIVVVEPSESFVLMGDETFVRIEEI